MVSIAMYPCIESFSLIFPEWKTDALPRTSVPWYKSWALSTGHLIWGYGEQHVLHGRGQEAGCLWDKQTSCTAGPATPCSHQVSLMFWGSVNPTPQAHQVWCTPNHQLHCEGAIQSMGTVSRRCWLARWEPYSCGAVSKLQLQVPNIVEGLRGLLVQLMNFVTPLFANCQVNGHVHLRLLSVSAVSFLNQLEKNTLKINLKCSI